MSIPSGEEMEARSMLNSCRSLLTAIKESSGKHLRNDHSIRLDSMVSQIGHFNTIKKG
jgi:hypothetical protein